MENEIKKISKFNIKTILFIIIIFIAIISLGTFAWLTYRSNDTSMVYTVGDINNVEITLSPYQIKTTISPVTSYTSEKYTNVTATNNSDTARDIKLYYQINSIAEELKITSFKYTIERSTNNGTSYTQYKTGNFVSAVSGNNMTILEESMPSNTTYKYKVYIWLDGSMGNQASASGKSLDCELRASIVEN